MHELRGIGARILEEAQSGGTIIGLKVRLLDPANKFVSALKRIAQTL